MVDCSEYYLPVAIIAGIPQEPWYPTTNMPLYERRGLMDDSVRATNSCIRTPPWPRSSNSARLQDSPGLTNIAPAKMFFRTSAVILALIGTLTFVAPVEAAARIMPLGDSITGSPVSYPPSSLSYILTQPLGLLACPSLEPAHQRRQNWPRHGRHAPSTRLRRQLRRRK